MISSAIKKKQAKHRQKLFLHIFKLLWNDTVDFSLENIAQNNALLCGDEMPDLRQEPW